MDVVRSNSRPWLPRSDLGCRSSEAPFDINAALTLAILEGRISGRNGIYVASLVSIIETVQSRRAGHNLFSCALSSSAPFRLPPDHQTV